MKTEILFKAKTHTLLLIKDEAEKNLSGIQNAEDIITNKSNSLLQILIPILILISGYLLNSITNQKFNELFYISIPLTLLLGLVIMKLYRNILPVKTAIYGSEPNKLIKSDMIFGVDESDERNIIVNRIYNLQKAIDYSIKNHSIRYKRFKNSNKILLLGLLIIFCSTIILLLTLFFLPFLNKC